MYKGFNRRDFLKVAGLVPLGLAVPRLTRAMDYLSTGQNVIVIVFDALSAHDISLYGFARQTTPNIDRLARRAVVYRNHFAAGNFTTPGTASLLTGVLPWTHRALDLNGRVSESHVQRNFFSAFPDHHRIAYTHNGLANTLLRQFEAHLDEFIPRESLYLESYDALITRLFRTDDDIASVAWIRNMKVQEEGSAYSLFLSHLYESLQDRQLRELKPLFPRGLPTVSAVHPYLLETSIDAVGRRLAEIRGPFAGYFHFMPPHHPYRTRREFVDVFRGDGFRPPEKPLEILAKKVTGELLRRRTEYDEFILYADQQFARLYDQLETSGLLENTWVVLTSDHGEMFERGITGHGSKVLYDPVVRIPLIIFEPGRQTRMDVHEYTSAVDVLPTLAHIAGQNLPAWTEGDVLPPYETGKIDSARNVYILQALDNAPHHPLVEASAALVREDHKLHYYFGYKELPEGESVKLFDIKADPEELEDLYSSRKGIALELLNELKVKLAEVNQPYL